MWIFLLLLAIPVLLIIIIFLLVEGGWGFFRPKENAEFIITKGTAVKFVRKDQDSFANKDAVTGKWSITHWPVPAWEQKLLCGPFGVRYFGIPFIYSLGEVVINYPPQLHSAVEGAHVQGNIVPGLDIHHNYLVILKNVEFQGGIAFEIQLNLEVELVRPDVAWGRNGRFLDPLGQAIEGRVKLLLLTVNATEFLGQTAQGLSDTQKATIALNAKSLRDKMCEECMKLNENTNQGGGDVVKLEELCGYKIVSISYKSIEPSDDNSRRRLNLLEDQNEASLRIDISKLDKERAEIDAQADAAKLKGKGLAQVEIDKARREALGDDLMIAEMNAEAIKSTGLSTLVMGGGVQPMIQLGTNQPRTANRPAPTPAPTPVPAASAPANTGTAGPTT